MSKRTRETILAELEREQIRLADLENQVFRPVTDGEVLKHLRGHQVMGVYPMLTDETCWFVAADFDKQAW